MKTWHHPQNHKSTTHWLPSKQNCATATDNSAFHPLWDGKTSISFGLSNNNKWRWWMRMVAAIYRRTHSPSRLAWSEGWRPPGAQYAFIKWTGWTFAVTMVMRTAHKHCRWLLLLFIIITCTENFTKFRRGFWDMQVDRHTDADCNPSHPSRWQSNKLNRSLNNNQY